MPFVRRVRALAFELPDDPIERAYLQLDVLRAYVHAGIEIRAQEERAMTRIAVYKALAWIDVLHSRARREIAMDSLIARIRYDNPNEPTP
jgi:hypothetical protein